MKRRIEKGFLTMLIIAALAIMSPQAASAAGTTSCTTVTNAATFAYSVGGIAQTDITSADATFTVGNKVNLTVVTTDGAAVSVNPGQATATAWLTFTVTNNGNTVQDYALAGLAKATTTTDPHGGSTDIFDATGFSVFVETAGGAGYQVGVDTDLFIDELAVDTGIAVYIVATGVPAIALGRANNDVAVYGLTATTRDGGSAGGGVGALTAKGALNTCGATADTVFADTAAGTGPDDGDLDGVDSDRSSFEVAAASLTVTKTAAVYWDPINLFGAARAAIPGAIMTYTIKASNLAGSATATAITITDNLNNEIANLGTVAFKTLYDDGNTTCVAGEGIIVGTTCKTNAGADDNADWNVTTTNEATVTGLSIAAGVFETVSFQVIIQ